jgi:(R,R)-butanediol dehydrogenase / meso-butanediol dehydrogenase / diacetyl reductase
MQAALYKGLRQIDVADIGPPTINDFQVLINVEACGICGSDLHTFREDWQPEKNVTVYPEGRVMGHEFSGTVAATGKSVTGARVGDRVVGISIGGGMAQQAAVYESPYTLCKIPDGVSFVAAATTEPMANALRIARLSEAQDGENVVVFGMGIIGLGVIQAYRAMGKKLNKLIAVDTSEVRLETALKLGADHVFNPKKEDVVSAITALCGKTKTVLNEEAPKVDVVCDCVGYIKKMPGVPVLQSALDLICDRTGRIVCFGIFEGDVKLNLHNLIFKQPKLIGVMGYDPQDVADALAMMSDGRIDRASLVTHQFPLDRAAEAFQAQDNYADSIKVVLLPQQSAARSA